jgi:hypothetical protein
MNKSIVVKIDQMRALMRHDAAPNASLYIHSSDGRRIKLIGRIVRPQQLQGFECEIYVSNDRTPEAREAGVLGAIAYDQSEEDLSRTVRVIVGVEARMFREFWRRSLTPPRRMQVTLHVRDTAGAAASGTLFEAGLTVTDLDVIFSS